MSKKYRLKGLRLDELSLVDRPANAQSKVAIWKRKDDNMTTKATNGDKKDMDKMSDAEKRRMRELMDKQGMAEKEAMSQAMREMRKQDNPDTDAGSPGTTPTSEKETGMDPNELEKRLGDLESQVDQLSKQAEDHGLTVEKADDGSVKLTKKAEEEYVEIGGEKVAKSQVPAGVLKAIEQQNEQIAKMQANQEAESLRKRAQTEIPNLAGSDDAKGKLLKAIDGLGEDVAKEVKESLTAADKAVSKMFAEVGKSVADDESSATYRLNKMAQDRASAQGETFEAAYAEVTKSDEGKRLLRESRTEAN